MYNISYIYQQSINKNYENIESHFIKNITNIYINYCLKNKYTIDFYLLSLMYKYDYNKIPTENELLYLVHQATYNTNATYNTDCGGDVSCDETSCSQKTCVSTNNCMCSTPTSIYLNRGGDRVLSLFTLSGHKR